MGLSEELIERINVFPNPSKGSIQISGVSIDDISDHALRDVIGKEMEYTFQSIDNSIRIEFEDDVTEGIYFVSLTLSSGQVISRSFIIE